jgi:3-oxoacyl-(acyl-carrier-protein) synthase
MNLFIQGVGAVSPLGPDAGTTWRQLVAGNHAPRKLLPNQLTGRRYHYVPVPEKFVAEAARQPRLRRSGIISLMGAAAAYDALTDAGIQPGQERAASCAVIYAVSSGGVNHTRRFFHELVNEGANAASPALFPETVYNAPASHLAALLGLDGQSYTLVGDSSVGLSALHLATELLTIHQELELCVVVGTEEADWVLADAYNTWRIVTHSAEFEVFGKSPGTILGEGAAAVVLGRTRGVPVLKTGPGLPFFSRSDASDVARRVVGSMVEREVPDCVFCSANGTFVDRIEEQLFRDLLPDTLVYAYKPALGESLGASALFQVVFATLALRHQTMPATCSGGDRLQTLSRESCSMPLARTLVTTVGFNHQVNCALIGNSIRTKAHTKTQRH